MDTVIERVLTSRRPPWIITTIMALAVCWKLFVGDYQNAALYSGMVLALWAIHLGLRKQPRPQPSELARIRGPFVVMIITAMIGAVVLSILSIAGIPPFDTRLGFVGAAFAISIPTTAVIAVKIRRDMKSAQKGQPEESHTR